MPFIRQHFGEKSRRTLLIGGAGFDPRSLVVPRMLNTATPSSVDGFFLRENRPNPSHKLSSRADLHIAQLQSLLKSCRIHDVSVFEEDGAVAIGRRVIESIRTLSLGEYTDVVVDFSALSIGTSFPLARFLLEKLEASVHRNACVTNLHAIVTGKPLTDDQIVPSPSTVVQQVHGFRGRYGIDETSLSARLWMPQLRFHQRGILDRLFDEITPDDVVPVLPFPSHDPRSGDRLIEHYAREFESRWHVDARSIVYANEGSPLDFYRTVLRIDDGRNPVFASTGGNLLVLSPIGSKVLALGAMMAATERDLPVMYVEALSYTVESIDDMNEGDYSCNDVVHVWLSGEAYPRPSKSTSDWSTPGSEQ